MGRVLQNVLLATYRVTLGGQTVGSMDRESEVVWAVVSLVVATAVVLPLLYRLRLPFRGLKVPPGSFGVPFVGENISLKIHQHDFYVYRMHRYGRIFKTHLFGHPSIVITTPEAAKFVLVDQAPCFRQRGLPIVEKLLGESFFGYQNHKMHHRLRKLMHRPLLPETLPSSIPLIEELALVVMQSWEGRSINALEEAKQYAFKVAMEFIIGAAPQHEKEELSKACEHLVRGVSSLPINIPGTNYHKALKDSRKKACALIDKIISWRRLERRPQSDILGILMDVEDEDGTKLTSKDIHDNILTLLFAGHDTVAAALTWTLKNLMDHPKLLEDVTAEHEMIQQKKSFPEETLTWSDITDQMPLSIRVVKETLRVANLADFSYREIVEDVEYGGFMFPKGWRLLVAHCVYHLSPEYYPNPEEFDTSRFKVAPRPYTFTPFGNGAHVCMGRELANLELLVFVHHFTLRYRCDPCGAADGSDYAPIHIPKAGLPINVRRRRKRSIVDQA